MPTKKTICISGSTRLAGVIGWPIRHTLSPAMHNAAFQHCGLDAVYVPFGVPAEGLRPLLAGLRQLGVLGVNVTVPYKVKVISLLDECAPSALQIGAVNTIVFKDNRLIGHNTDGFGFLASLKGVIEPRGKNVMLLGAGGAGRAVAISLARARVGKLSIAEVDPKRLNQLIREIKKQGFSQVEGCRPASVEFKQKLSAASFLVNATPLGLKPTDPLPIPEDWMPKKICVMDLVYGKSITPFLRLAGQRHNRLIPGWKMLLYQGAEAFRLWTGLKPPVELMQKALVAAGGLKH